MSLENLVELRRAAAQRISEDFIPEVYFQDDRTK